MQTVNTNKFLAFGQAIDNLWLLMPLSLWHMQVDACNSPCSQSVTMNHMLRPLMPLVSGVCDAIKKVRRIESRGILFTNNTLHGIDFSQYSLSPQALGCGSLMRHFIREKKGQFKWLIPSFMSSNTDGITCAFWMLNLNDICSDWAIKSQYKSATE